VQTSTPALPTCEHSSANIHASSTLIQSLSPLVGLPTQAPHIQTGAQPCQQPCCPAPVGSPSAHEHNAGAAVGLTRHPVAVTAAGQRHRDTEGIYMHLRTHMGWGRGGMRRGGWGFCRPRSSPSCNGGCRRTNARVQTHNGWQVRSRKELQVVNKGGDNNVHCWSVTLSPL
jgi:hypothetical protein